MKYPLSLLVLLLSFITFSQKPVAELAFDFTTTTGNLGSDPRNFIEFDDRVFFNLSGDEPSSLAYYPNNNQEIEQLQIYFGSELVSVLPRIVIGDTLLCTFPYNDSLRSNLGYILAGTSELNIIGSDTGSVNIMAYGKLVPFENYIYWERRNNANGNKELMRFSFETLQEELVMQTQSVPYGPENAIQGIFDEKMFIRIDYQGPLLTIQNNIIDTVQLIDGNGAMLNCYGILAYHEGNFLFSAGSFTGFKAANADTVKTIPQTYQETIQYDSLVLIYRAIDSAYSYFSGSFNLNTGEFTYLTEMRSVYNQSDIALFKGNAYFFLDDSLGRDQLWKSDFTKEGTEPIFIFPGSDPLNMKVFGDHLLFEKTGQIWYMDSQSTQPKIFQLGIDRVSFDLFSGYHAPTNTAIIRARSSTNGGGEEPWEIDFNSKSVSLLGDYVFSTQSTLYNGIDTVAGKMVLVVPKNRYYHSKGNHQQLYYSDGTLSGTEFQYEFYGTNGNYLDGAPYSFFSFNDSIFFYQDRNLWGAPEGEEPKLLEEQYIYDVGDPEALQRFNGVGFIEIYEKITPSNPYAQSYSILKTFDKSPRNLSVIHPEANEDLYITYPNTYVEHEGWLYFTGILINEVQYRNQNCLFRTKGSSETTEIVFEDFRASRMVFTEEHLYYVINPSLSKGSIHRIDLSTGFSEQILPNGYKEGQVKYLKMYDGHLFFSASTNSGLELWKVKVGTTVASRVADLIAGSKGSSPAAFAVLNDKFMFIADSDEFGFDGALFVLDSANAEPRMIHVLERPYTYDRDVTYFGDRVAFRYRYSIPVREAMVVSDGTKEGTASIMTSAEGYNITSISKPVILNNRIYFHASSDVVGSELFTIGSCAENMDKPVVAENQGFLETSTNYNEYQWYDCDLVKKIPGADEPSFQPEKSGWYKVQASNGACSLSSECVYFEATGTSIQEKSQVLMSLYPNPSKGLFNLKANFLMEKVEVYDVSGRRIFTADPLKNSLEINLTDHESGIYMLKVFAENGNFSRSLVIQ